MIDAEFTLEDLAQNSGLPIRTLRYYISEGLLPGPDTRGKFATYSQEHMDSVELIVRLKDMHLPLKEIKHLLDNMSADEVKKLIKYQDALKIPQTLEESKHEAVVEKDPDSALEYIHSLNQAQVSAKSFSDTTRTLRQSFLPSHKNQMDDQSKRETWQRIELADGIELNVRLPLEKNIKELIEKMIKIVQATK